MDYKLIDNIEFDYDLKDFPDFSDAQIISADYNGIPMNKEQLDEINDDSDFIHEELLKHLY